MLHTLRPKHIHTSHARFMAETYLKKSTKNAEAMLDLGPACEPGAFEAAWADVEYWQAKLNQLNGAMP